MIGLNKDLVPDDKVNSRQKNLNYQMALLMTGQFYKITVGLQVYIQVSNTECSEAEMK